MITIMLTVWKYNIISAWSVYMVYMMNTTHKVTNVHISHEQMNVTTFYCQTEWGLCSPRTMLIRQNILSHDRKMLTNGKPIHLLSNGRIFSFFLKVLWMQKKTNNLFPVSLPYLPPTCPNPRTSIFLWYFFGRKMYMYIVFLGA